MHFHRAEHCCGQRNRESHCGKIRRCYLLKINRPIPFGKTARLENPENPLHLIEVQSGVYLGEDDIVRALRIPTVEPFDELVSYQKRFQHTLQRLRVRHFYKIF